MQFPRSLCIYLYLVGNTKYTEANINRTPKSMFNKTDGLILTRGEPQFGDIHEGL